MLGLIFLQFRVLQVSQLQCTAPVYATHPVSKMGQMFLYDQCLNRAAVSEFDAFDLNDVDKAFAHITTLKYQQVFSLTGQPLNSRISMLPFFVPGQALIEYQDIADVIFIFAPKLFAVGDMPMLRFCSRRPEETQPMSLTLRRAVTICSSTAEEKPSLKC